MCIGTNDSHELSHIYGSEWVLLDIAEGGSKHNCVLPTATIHTMERQRQQKIIMMVSVHGMTCRLNSCKDTQ